MVRQAQLDDWLVHEGENDDAGDAGAHQQVLSIPRPTVLCTES